MSDSYLTTDALPSPPRDEPNLSSHNGSAKEEIPKEPKDRRNSDNEGFEPKSQSVPNGSFFHNNKGPQVINNVIQVINSPATHIGTVNHFHNSSTKFQRFNPENVIETEKMKSLKLSNEPVFEKDIDAIKDHIGHNYTSIFNKLDLSDGEIKQAEMRYSKNEISEMMRALLTYWRQKNFKSVATVGKLARALWDCNEYAALKMWASQYDDLHRNK